MKKRPADRHGPAVHGGFCDESQEKQALLATVRESSEASKNIEKQHIWGTFMPHVFGTLTGSSKSTFDHNVTVEWLDIMRSMEFIQILLMAFLICIQVCHASTTNPRPPFRRLEPEATFGGRKNLCKGGISSRVQSTLASHARPRQQRWTVRIQSGVCCPTC